MRVGVRNATGSMAVRPVLGWSKYLDGQHQQAAIFSTQVQIVNLTGSKNASVSPFSFAILSVYSLH